MDDRTNLVPSGAELAYSGAIFNVYRWKPTPASDLTPDFERVIARGSVNLILVSSDDKIILAKQHQVGRPPFQGLLGGRIEPGETPQQAATRELLEETSIAAATWRCIGWRSAHYKVYWPQYYYVVDIGPVEPRNSDPRERLEFQKLSLDEFCAWIASESSSDYILKSMVLARLYTLRTPLTIDSLFAPWADEEG